MGNFRETITLVNIKDEVRVEAGMRTDVRQATVEAVVDTGATSLVIDGELCRRLGLAIVKTRWSVFANGTRQECGVTEPVTVCWKNRSADVNAIVVSGAKSVLLGAIPLEGMDLIVDPVRQCLTGAHGEEELVLAL